MTKGRFLAMEYKEMLYKILELDCRHLDALYEDYIIHTIGITGLTFLRSNGYLESCGVVNGRSLYTLLPWKD